MTVTFFDAPSYMIEIRIAAANRTASRTWLVPALSVPIPFFSFFVEAFVAAPFDFPLRPSQPSQKATKSVRKMP